VYKEVAIMWKNKKRSVDQGGVFGLSIIKHVTLQKIVAYDFRYDPCTYTLVRRFRSCSSHGCCWFFPVGSSEGSGDVVWLLA
jgi:hypothetical protein